MAFPQWRRDKKRVYVYYVDPTTGKQVQLPRKLTAHLDGMPPDAVYAWVENWEREHGLTRARALRTVLAEDDPLRALWRHYQKSRMSLKKRRPITIEQENARFDNVIVPFFVTTHQKKDPATWHSLVPAFHTHLFSTNYVDSTIREILWTLNRFGKHLVFHGHMTFPFAIQTPTRDDPKVTPLKTKKTPEEILAFVKEFNCPYKKVDFKLAVLLGYFAGLRPSELFALDKSDLLTGEDAAANTDTLESFRSLGLGSKLSVSVTKTLQDEEGAVPIELTKSDSSRGIVNVWNVEAAKMIAAIVKDMPDGRLFRFSYSWLHKLWGRYLNNPDKGRALGLTPHDTRRASGLYLGRTLRIPLTLLKDHMRHAEIETTMLYVREPSKAVERKKAKQDFDDVA